jgi:hypothetical protein
MGGSAYTIRTFTAISVSRPCCAKPRGLRNLVTKAYVAGPPLPNGCRFGCKSPYAIMATTRSESAAGNDVSGYTPQRVARHKRYKRPLQSGCRTRSSNAESVKRHACTPPPRISKRRAGRKFIGPLRLKFLPTQRSSSCNAAKQDASQRPERRTSTSSLEGRPFQRRAIRSGWDG